jgi:hypothetical protein
MNERYQGGGPQGQTKKSASSFKPKAQAAASVHIEAKPTTKQERKAASRRREAEEKRKAEERARKQAQRERAQRIAAGLEPETNKRSGFFGGILDKIFPKTQTVSASSGAKALGANGTGGSASGLKSQGSNTSASQTSQTKPSLYPQTPEYKRWRKVYWVLIAIGVASVATTFILQVNFPQDSTWMPMMAIAYIFIIAGLVLDFAKIRPLVKAHQAQLRGGSKKSPKQIKHEQEAAARAREIEEYNKARKLARSNRGLGLLGLKGDKKSDSGSGDDAVDEASANEATSASAEYSTDETTSANEATSASAIASANEATSAKFTEDELNDMLNDNKKA